MGWTVRYTNVYRRTSHQRTIGGTGTRDTGSPNVSYKCVVAFCPAECRKRADMRVHIRNKHKPLPKQDRRNTSSSRDNKGSLYSGFLILKGEAQKKKRTIQVRQRERTTLKTVEWKEVNLPSTSQDYQYIKGTAGGNGDKLIQKTFWIRAKNIGSVGFLFINWSLFFFS